MSTTQRIVAFAVHNGTLHLFNTADEYRAFLYTHAYSVAGWVDDVESHPALITSHPTMGQSVIKDCVIVDTGRPAASLVVDPTLSDLAREWQAEPVGHGVNPDFGIVDADMIVGSIVGEDDDSYDEDKSC